MSYTIADVKSDLSAMLKGTTTDKIPNIFSILKRAGRQLLLDIDPDETKRISEITNALYDNVYDYQLPADVKGKKIIDIRPYVNRSGKVTQRTSETFDFDKENDTIQIKNNSGVKSIRIAASVSAPKTIETFSSLTSGGTLTGNDDCTNLTLDVQNYVAGSSSINFDLSGAGTTGYIDKTYSTVFDLSDYEDKSAFFLYLYLPDSSILTSITLWWGNDTSNYFSATATQAQDGAFHNGWNLIRFDWNGATETGSVDTTAIDYIRFSFVYDGTADTDLRLDSLTLALGQIYESEYYSKYLYTDTNGTWKENPETDSDIVKLDTDSYNIYLNKVAELACQTVQRLNADVGYFRQEYQQGIIAYQSDRKSEAKRIKQNYYTLLKR